MNSESPWATKRPVPFTNVSGETIPAFAAMAITGLVHENGIAFLQCDKPGTTFVREYAVNNMFDVPAGLRGTCFRAGDLRVLYDAAAPAAGEGWGPKPGQWSLSRGYPGFSIQGVVDSQHRIAKTFYEPIAQVLVKTTGAVAPGATTADYRVYAGTFGSEEDAGFTTVPTARNRTGQSLDADEWAWLAWTGGGWELRCNQNRVYHCTYAGSLLLAGSTGGVTLPDGRAATFINWSTDTTINTNDKILVWQDFTDGGFFGIRSGDANIDRVWHGAAQENIAAGAAGDVILGDATVLSATNWSNGGADIADGDYVLVWQDPIDNLYYCIKSGGTGGARMFDCYLNADLASIDPTIEVAGLSAYDSGPLPADPLAGVSNRWHLSGKPADPAVIVYHPGADEYRLLQVNHVVREVLVDVEYDAATHALRKKTQGITALHEADAGAFVAYKTAVETDLVVDVFFDGQLRQSIRSSAYVLEAPAAADVAVLAFSEQSFVADVYMSGIDLHKTKRTLLTPELGAPVDQIVFQGTNCDTTMAGAPQAARQQMIQTEAAFTFDPQNYTRPTSPPTP
jgi:hypothetical protein